MAMTAVTSTLSGTTVDPAKLDTHPDVELKTVKGGCCSAVDYYVLNQTFAIVRHADRLDHTEEWVSYPGREAFPNDTPLTPEGFTHARQVGDLMFKQEPPFKMIIASPYLRCAQTASCIAQKLNVPVHFDLDLGEVFDDISMMGDCRGKQQHRPPDVLEGELKGDFPDVEYIRDHHGKIKVEGKLQRFPEPFEGARMRYCFKVQRLIQQATKELSSIVIVTHGDAVASVVGMLKESWIIKNIPYTSYVIGSRHVRIMKSGAKERLPEEPVYSHPEQWTLVLDPGLVHVDCRKEDLAKAHQVHEKEMVEMEKKQKTIKTVYTLAPHQRRHVATSLGEMDASKKEHKHLMKKASTTTFAAENRIACHPDHHVRVKRTASGSALVKEPNSPASPRGPPKTSHSAPP